MDLVVHTLCTTFSASYKLLVSLHCSSKSRYYQFTCSSLFFCQLSLSLCLSLAVEAGSMERKRTLIEKVRKDSTVEEEVENEVEEEDENGVGVIEEEKRKVSGGSGRRGSSSGGGGISPPSCQAERCGADLSDAKRYHRRHKVCEFHSKAPAVEVAGLRQRFCQQCSRFHDLAEFDEAKRSCRRRLAGHNERRRKSYPETCNEGCSHSKGHHCRLADERGRIQMNMPGSSAYKSFHIR